MLLTRHKLLLLGIGWFSLALLVLGGLVAYAVLNVPLPPVPPTVAVLAHAPAPTLPPPQLAAVPSATAGTPASPTPTNTLVVRSPTPSATASTTHTPALTPTASVTPAPTRTRRPAARATAAPTSLQPPAATSTPVTPGVPVPTPTTTNTAPPSTLTHTALPPTATATATTVPPTVPPAPPAVPIADFWGVNGGPIDGNASTFPLDGDLSYYPALRNNSFYWMNQAGLRWFRNYNSDGINFSWQFVEPAKGVFDWSAWDALVTAAQARDVTLLAGIGNSVPQWASASANWRAKPTDLYTDPMQNTAWYQYVQTVVERYDGDGQNDMPGLTRPIKFWELWNEPDLRDANHPPDYPARQFDGTITAYVRLTQVGYAAVKAADPSAQVVGPSSAQAPNNTSHEPLFMWSWNDWLAAGGAHYVDIVSFHLYFDPNGWDSTGHIDNLLYAMDTYRAGKPVWVTEIGWAGGATSDFESKNNDFVRSAVLLMQLPAIQREFWYDFQESETFAGTVNHAFLQTLSGGASRGVDPDPLFHPLFRVAQVMARLLAGYGGDARPSAVDVGGAARAYHFSAGGQDVWVVWLRAASGSASINLDTGGRPLRVVDLYGASGGTFAGGALTVGPEPTYLTTQLDWNPNLGTITGRVSHAGQAGQLNNGAGGVAMTLSGPVSGSATTNGDGNYEFDNLPDGAYVVTAAGAGTQNVTVDRRAPWGRTSFALNP